MAAKASTPVPIYATVRGVESCCTGSGGAAAGLVVSAGLPGPGTSQVSAATGSMVPAPTSEDGDRSAPRAVTVSLRTTCSALSSGNRLRTRAATPDTYAAA